MYICICSGVTEDDVEEASCKVPLEVFIKMTGATKCCGTCKDTIKSMFAQKTKECDNKIICQNI